MPAVVERIHHFSEIQSTNRGCRGWQVRRAALKARLAPATIASPVDRPELEAAKAGGEIAEQQDDVAAKAIGLLDDGVDALDRIHGPQA